MAFRGRFITGIVIVCSLVLANCAFPVRPGYDRKSGSYKRYRVPKQEVVEADTSVVDSLGELSQEEKLAAAGVVEDTTQSTPQAVTADTLSKSSDLPKAVLAQNKPDSTKSQQTTSEQASQSDTLKVADGKTTKTADKAVEKAAVKKTDKTAKKEKKAAKPTNLEKYAKEWLGAKYVYGAANKRKTDCSGYVMQVYKGFYGIALDHNAQHIFDDGRGYSIKKTKLQEGDLVFFGNFWKISHVGIYLKGNRFIHASTSKGVVITPMDDNYWASKYKGARRFK